MESAIWSPTHIISFGIGFLVGSLLRLVLNQFKSLVSRLEGPQAQGFSNYAFWIVAGWVLLASYLLYIRNSPIGSQLHLAGALYAGALLPFAAQAGLFVWIKRALHRSTHTGPHEPMAFHALTNLERLALSSQSLSHLAMLVWCVSLFLPVFAKSPYKYESGGEVLLGGWMGIVVLQFAWFANPLFLFAYVRLQNGHGAITYAAIALAVSLETFLNVPFLGAYGYGWGMILWFVSLALLFAAAGAHELRGGLRPTLENHGWMRTFGIALAAGIAVAGIGLSAIDHSGANQAETARMANVAIKRGAVCRLEPVSVSPLVTPLAGAVEIKQMSAGSQAKSNELSVVRNLLSWGFPVLRMDGRDFFYIRSDRESLLSSVPARGAPGATLEVGGTREEVQLRLFDNQHRPLLEQHWFLQNKGEGYCPDYYPDPTPEQPPRAIISAALRIVAPAVERRQAAIQTRLAGEVVGRSQGSPSKPRPIRNANCGQDTGWRESERLSNVLTSARAQGFWIGEQAFYPSTQFYGKALCQGETIYLYDASLPSAGQAYLTLEKRRRAGLLLVGSTFISIKDAAIAGDTLQLESVEESSQGLIIEVSSPSLGLSFRVKAGVGL
ncbi:hypothetical protein [Pseudomonas sp. W5-36]|uniref:hypothetical protein n=1 Tax=Pseudomonas sp. W5-36 TaxID=3097455 RepID=UPI00397B05BB